MAQQAAVPDPGPRRVVERGRYYEDFNLGDVYRHHWGRTLTDGEAQLFATATMNAVPLYFNKLHAQALGHRLPPVHPLLVMNVVFGMTVEDLSEQAIAHLGYWNMTFPRWVYPGDTLISKSEVLDKRESGSKPDRGIVHVRTTGLNQRGEEVCVYERRILVKKRAAHGGR
ncbi:MAG TPA: MaoC family dehydratase [Myxococcales bacterium]